MLDPELFLRLRQERGLTWGRPLRLYEQTSSTSDRALEEASSDCRTGAVYVAREQTQGRGRRGQRWTAPPGENLTFSVLLRCPVPAEALSGYSLVVGLALLDALRPRLAQPEELQLKWPNDLLYQKQKLCGILVESRTHAPGHAPLEAFLLPQAPSFPLTSLVVGIGLNVLTTQFPPELGRVCSLFQLGAQDLSFESLLVDILRALEKRTLRFFAQGLSRVHPELQAADALLGAPLRVDGQAGIARGLTPDGQLRLELEDGSLRDFATGHVEWLPE